MKNPIDEYIDALQAKMKMAQSPPVINKYAGGGGPVYAKGTKLMATGNKIPDFTINKRMEYGFKVFDKKENSREAIHRAAVLIKIEKLAKEYAPSDTT